MNLVVRSLFGYSSHSLLMSLQYVCSSVTWAATLGGALTGSGKRVDGLRSSVLERMLSVLSHLFRLWMQHGCVCRTEYMDYEQLRVRCSSSRLCNKPIAIKHFHQYPSVRCARILQVKQEEHNRIELSVPLMALETCSSPIAVCSFWFNNEASKNILFSHWSRRHDLHGLPDVSGNLFVVRMSVFDWNAGRPNFLRADVPTRGNAKFWLERSWSWVAPRIPLALESHVPTFGWCLVLLYCLRMLVFKVTPSAVCVGLLRSALPSSVR